MNYKKNNIWAEHLAIVSQVGLTMAGCIIFCFFVGRWLDKIMGTSGIMAVIFIILGVVGGGVVIYRQIMEVTEYNE